MIETIWPDTSTVALSDRLLHRMGQYPGYCNICGQITFFDTHEANFREHTPCRKCQSVNRYRQMMAVLLHLALGRGAGRFSSLRDLPRSLTVWNAEATRALHLHLKAHLGGNYVSSEYIDPELPSGTEVDGVLHVDMQKTHFRDESLDFILSSDVVEHVPFYRDALRETWRILKFGGAHVFTIPFYHHRFTIERRATMAADGSIEHHLKPWFHGDPLRPDGVLCFNVFAPELLAELEAIGFEAQLLRVHSPVHGILGNNGFVLVARKTRAPLHRSDLIFPDAPPDAPTA